MKIARRREPSIFEPGRREIVAGGAPWTALLPRQSDQAGPPSGFLNGAPNSLPSSSVGERKASIVKIVQSRRRARSRRRKGRIRANFQLL